MTSAIKSLSIDIPSRPATSVSNKIETHSDFPNHRLQRSASYAVGSGKKATALVSEQNGYLWQLPVAWFAHDRSWRMNPGFELRNHRFGRPVTPGCVACHSTTAVHQAPTRNRFRVPVPSGISCQRCHGATEQHVAYWQAARREDPSPDPQARQTPDADAAVKAATTKHPASLAHTINLSDGQRNDLCLQCHLQGDATVYESGSGPLTFSPGDRLKDHRHDFLIATENAPLGIASHGARMLQSRCYTESGGKLTCVLCHDPHRPAADFDSGHYDARCATCHAPQSCSRPQPRPREETMSGCVTCHMPRRPSQEGIHLVLTDHALQAQPNAWAAEQPPALALQPNAAQVELVSAWPDASPAKLTRGAAYVVLHETLGPQPAALQAARVLLSDAMEEEPDNIEILYWLGSAMVGLGEGDRAVELLSEVVRRRPGDSKARFRLAAGYELVGDFSSAASAYRQLVEDVPDWMEPYPRLAQLYIAQQNPRWAVAVLEKQISYHDDALAQAQLALARRLVGGSHQLSMQRIERALQLDPQLHRAYLVRAGLSLLAGDPKRARDDFEFVLRLDPGNAEARPGASSAQSQLAIRICRWSL